MKAIHPKYIKLMKGSIINLSKVRSISYAGEMGIKVYFDNGGLKVFNYDTEYERDLLFDKLEAALLGPVLLLREDSDDLS